MKKASTKKKLSIGCLGTILFLFLTGWMLRLWLGIEPPSVEDSPLMHQEVVQSENGLRSIGNNHLRKSNSGLWEMYLEGKPFDRGVAAGKLSETLLQYQEDVFVDQIRQIVPSKTYLMLLRNFIAFFNKDLPNHIPDELKEEIYGISLSCTHEYDYIGTPYERQLNYHAAHDLGHAMQDYMLVGCTSFAVWNQYAQDSLLLIGRNFDFYAGDDFARNKLVAFYHPEQGYDFAMVGWAGMTGVLSGMNSEGLTVTINAAKSSMPTSSATPISILCREILQYAATIDEAYRIAQQKRTFVSESILIGSAKDNRAAIIEKSPNMTGMYTPTTDWLVCANHYQGEVFQQDEYNLENIRTSDSPYRQQRTEELLLQLFPLNPEKAASILRDKNGSGGKNIGLGNEKALNQMIGHHSVIFVPQKLQIWVSTAPWQLGEYVAYDLKQIFATPDFSREIRIDSLTIPADTLAQSQAFYDFLDYRDFSRKLPAIIDIKQTISEDEINSFLTKNPEYYYGYELIGDYYAAQKEIPQATQYWEIALNKEIPKLQDKERVEQKIKDHKKK